MKRFASHYIWLPDRGYFKQYAVEIDCSGIAVRLFPLTEEIESAEWLPGVIALLSDEEAVELNVCYAEKIKNTGMAAKNIPVFHRINQMNSTQATLYSEPDTRSVILKNKCRYPYLFYPFDFTSMQPVAGTRHRLLR